MEANVGKLEKERQKAKSEWDSDCARLAELDAYLKSAFINEVQQIKFKMLLTEKSAVEKWCYQQYLSIIMYDAERIIADEPAR
jgi:hypothetical protein